MSARHLIENTGAAGLPDDTNIRNVNHLHSIYATKNDFLCDFKIDLLSVDSNKNMGIISQSINHFVYQIDIKDTVTTKQNSQQDTESALQRKQQISAISARPYITVQHHSPGGSTWHALYEHILQ